MLYEKSPFGDGQAMLFSFRARMFINLSFQYALLLQLVLVIAGFVYLDWYWPVLAIMSFYAVGIAIGSWPPGWMMNFLILWAMLIIGTIFTVLFFSID